METVATCQDQILDLKSKSDSKKHSRFDLKNKVLEKWVILRNSLRDLCCIFLTFKNYFVLCFKLHVFLQFCTLNSMFIEFMFDFALNLAIQ